MKKFLFACFFLALAATFQYCKSRQENSTSSGNISTKEDYTPPANLKEGLNIGNIAPELSFKNPKDSVISLSSLRGYYVLIDFWASWCGPCRRENPNVVSAYKKFSKQKMLKGKGFTVFSVSLDNSKGMWINAIQRDSLIWPGHISDLLGWDTKLGAKYGVQSIPTNWLIDPRGVIIATELRGNFLHEKLQQYIDTTATPAVKDKKNKKK